MIKIIHISDFHLENRNPSTAKKDIVGALVEDLKKFTDENTVLFFTGDLIDKGGKNFGDKKTEAFSLFEENFLHPILNQNPILKQRIFVVPGNHDVFREKSDSITEIGLKNILTSTENVNEFLLTNRQESKHLETIVDYKKWERNFYSTYSDCQLSNFDNSFILKLGTHKVGVTCLNSSWLCKDDSDKGNLIIGKSQIEKSLVKIRNCDIKLILAHHPIDFLKEFDKESIEPDLYKNYDAFFTGHVHELDSLYKQNLYGSIFLSVANSTIADNPSERKYVNGYSIVELYPNQKVKVLYRKYVENHKAFVSNTDVGNDDGTKEFFILKDEELTKNEKAKARVEHIYNQHCEKLDDHLIMANNQTNVQCSIDNVFVEPTILNCPENAFKEEETESYSVENIISQKSNFLIYGIKESGRTILLDKMFLDSIKHFDTLKKTPVLIKFSDFKNKEIEKVVKEFLGLSTQNAREFLSQNEVILFIDDLSFSDKNNSHLESLKQFIKGFPKVQIVATVKQVLDNIIPTDYLKYNDFFQFKIGFIQSLNSSQIKQFISKWFAGKEIDLQDNMEKLMKNFTDFGLPRTPLSVTLFLWIFEKQEKRPINNSVLVEMFIENLLEKVNIENIYSDTFDFKNKQRLLSFIAKHMKDTGNGDLNYCVDYVELLSFVKGYLETRFHGQPQKVLDDLLKRGVLSYEEGNLVRFKSAFFFHYFLALHFDYDSEFKSHVFTEENYLDYIEEIIYYTGLKRDDVQILNFTQEKLLEAYGDFNADLTENYKRIDEVLETKSKEETLSFQIDESKLKNKPSEKQIEEVYDTQLANIPIQKNIPKKESEALNTKANKDRVLKLAATVLKNSEDVDSFEVKTMSYKNVLLSSIAFLMEYRDYLISYYIKHKKEPDHFPKNINFNLFIKVLPLIHQVVVFNWLGSQKLRAVIIDKIEKDKTTLNISEFEKFLSVFIYSDIRGSDYPQKLKLFIKNAKFNYNKDLSFLKVLSYYHLRSKNEELDKFYLKLLSEIKEDLGQLDKNKKSQFMKEIEEKKKGG